jgi:hypothetical protein
VFAVPYVPVLAVGDELLLQAEGRDEGSSGGGGESAEEQVRYSVQNAQCKEPRADMWAGKTEWGTRKSWLYILCYPHMEMDLEYCIMYAVVIIVEL